MTSKRSPKQNRRIFGQWLFFGAIAVFGVLIIVLLVKPAGLLGKYVPEKV